MNSAYYPEMPFTNTSRKHRIPGQRCASLVAYHYQGELRAEPVCELLGKHLILENIPALLAAVSTT